ncbi:MAG: hypothetical protein H9847_01675 [Candidatus Anaerobiospirillum pullicola]|uniref:Uncharacterized protein n=1 Tax=Candidatus Anaerobiospirillum pullicola TaxID=2838451 RepID=A0A948TF25_9GAMM|nr:hypothetical protein [Candidatus Anaerobiospirillum pullicola]
MQPCSRGNDNEYYNTPRRFYSDDRYVQFKTPRFTNIWFNLDLLKLAIHADEIDSEQANQGYFNIFHLVDTTNMRDMVYGTPAFPLDIAASFKLVVDALKSNGLDLSHTLFTFQSTNKDDAATVAQVIVDAGANYFISTNRTAYPKGKLPTLRNAQRQFAQCRSVLAHKWDAFKNSDFIDPEAIIAVNKNDEEVCYLVRDQLSVILTSVDVNNHDEANKLACALNEFGIYKDILECEDMLYGHHFAEDIPEEFVTNKTEDGIRYGMAMQTLKDDFDRFVMAKMKADLKQDKHAYKQLATKSGVAELLKDDDTFLRFFALYYKDLMSEAEGK